jgi:drug/metabolite transporter (DMT)-like permease
MTARRVSGLLVGFVGVVVLVHEELLAGWGSSSKEKTFVLLGQGAMLLSSAFYGISNVYARIKLRGVPPIVQAFYTMLLADAVMWIITPAIERPFTLPAEPLTWVAIGWLGVLGAGVCYVIFYHLLHSIGPTRVAMVTYTIPVVGVTLGVLLLKEDLNWALVVGTILIVSGIWGVNRR